MTRRHPERLYYYDLSTKNGKLVDEIPDQVGDDGEVPAMTGMPGNDGEGYSLYLALKASQL